MTHTLRVAAGLSTKNATQFAITRNIQQVGANLTVTNNREIIAYTLEGTRKAVEEVIPFLTEVTTQQEFRPWEVSDNVPRQRLELAIRPPQVRLFFLSAVEAIIIIKNRAAVLYDFLLSLTKTAISCNCTVVVFSFS